MGKECVDAVLYINLILAGNAETRENETEVLARHFYSWQDVKKRARVIFVLKICFSDCRGRVGQ